MNDESIDQLLRGSVPAIDDAAHDRAKERLMLAIEQAEHAPSGLRSRRFTWWAAAAAIALTIVVASAVLLPPNRAPSASARILELGRLAAAQPSIHVDPNDVLYRRYEERRSDVFTSVADGSSYVTESHVMTQSWLRGDGSGLVRSRWLEDTGFPSPEDRQAWISAGRLPLHAVGDVVSTEYGPGELRVYDIEALPTDPDQLRSVLEQGVVYDPGSPTSHNLMSAIGTLLEEQDLPPDLRQALFEVASRLPGVEVRDGALDPLGRSAIAVVFPIEDSSVALYFDPATADLLAQTESQVSPNGGSISESQAYLVAAIVSEVGESPGE